MRTMGGLLLVLGLLVTVQAQGQEAAWTREDFVAQLESKNFHSLDEQLTVMQEPALADLSAYRAYARAVDALAGVRPLRKV